MKVNNVTRMLDAKHVTYTAFELSAEKHSAVDTATILGVDPETVFKTIVVLREKPGKPILAVIPAPYVVDLKALACLAGEKKLHLPTQQEAERLTGLQAGGISALALINKGFQVFLDSHAENLEKMHVSGGERGLNIRLPVQDFLSLTHARTGMICTSDPNVSQDGEQSLD
jgi:Cys-tRNA(Pro)/Cys-tRNA(Cys) deacylase